MDLSKTDLLGININTNSEEELVDRVGQYLDSADKNMIFTPNPEFVVETRINSEFRDVLNKASLNLPDGIGLLWATTFLALPNRFIKNKYLNRFYNLFQFSYSLVLLLIFPYFCKRIIKERVSGADFFWRVVNLCSTKKKRIFLLGASNGVAIKVRDRLIDVYPNLQVCGTFSGNPDKMFDEDICHLINQSNPDVLFVAYGAPKQEFWIDRNMTNLKSLKVAIGVGGTFDFVAGVTKRAPLYMRRFGLEWLYRLVKYPSRIKRIYNATFKFMYIVLKAKLSSISK